MRLPIPGPARRRSRPIPGAGASPAIRRRGRPARPTAPRRGRPRSTPSSAAGRTTGTTATWCCTTRRLRRDAGGVDAFLIGSELKALTRVRSASGVYPAVDALVSLAAEVKAIVGGGTKVTYGADWTEYGAHVVDPDAERSALSARCRCGRRRRSMPSASTTTRRWPTGATTPMRSTARLSDSIYRADYLAGNLARGEAYDWYYADASARDAQTRTPISDGLGKPWMFRAEGHLEFLVAARITSASAARSWRAPRPGRRRASRSG